MRRATRAASGELPRAALSSAAPLFCPLRDRALARAVPRAAARLPSGAASHVVDLGQEAHDLADRLARVGLLLAGQLQLI